MHRAEARGARVQRAAAAAAKEAMWRHAAESIEVAMRRDPCEFCVAHTVDVPWAWWGEQFERKGWKQSNKFSEGAWIMGVTFEGTDLRNPIFEVQPRSDKDDKWDRTTSQIELTWEDLIGGRTFGTHNLACRLARYEANAAVMVEGLGALGFKPGCF